MKKITFLLFTFLTFNFQLSAQNITLEITGTPCDGGSPYTLTPFGTNGKNQYNAVVGGSGDQIRMEWSSGQSRWELNLYDSGNTFQETEFFNTADTPSDPPCFSFDNSWSAASGATCSASAISNLTGNCDTSAANVASASIPTLSEWGLIILALLLMTFGTLQLIRRESKRTA